MFRGLLSKTAPGCDIGRRQRRAIRHAACVIVMMPLCGPDYGVPDQLDVVRPTSTLAINFIYEDK